MTKEKLSWIVIRFLGLILAYKAIYSIIAIVLILRIVLANIGNFFETTIIVDNLYLLGSILKNFIIIIIAIYLLKCGRLLYKFVNNNILIENEEQIKVSEIFLFIIRGCGLWFFIAAVLMLFNVLSDFFMLLYLKKLVFYFGDNYQQGLRNIINFIISERTLDYLIKFAFYVLAAWYLLKKGRLLIRLFNYLVESAIRHNDPVTKAL